MKTLAAWQKRIFLTSWGAYVGAYLCRANLPIVLPGMIGELDLNKVNAGLIGFSFFWAYALGQLINGYIGDKVRSRFFVFSGLLFAAAVNLLFGFTSSLTVMIVLWAGNGFFLSMLWGPIIKTLSYWYSPEQKTRIAVKISTSIPGGYLLTWGFIGWIISIASWRWAFWLPALLVSLYSFVWLYNIRNHPREVGLDSPGKDSRSADNQHQHELRLLEERRRSEGEVLERREKADLGVTLDRADVLENQKKTTGLGRLIIEERLWLLAITCMAQGLVREGIILWGPTLLGEVFALEQFQISLISLLIPLISLAGILGSGLITKLAGFEKKSIIILLAGGAFFASVLYLLFGSNLYLNAVLLALIVAAMYGANTILLTVIPFNYADKNRVSGIAGFLDFSSYMGAALAGGLLGFIIERAGWRAVIMVWSLAAVGGILSVLISLNKKQNIEV